MQQQGFRNKYLLTILIYMQINCNSLREKESCISYPKSYKTFESWGSFLIIIFDCHESNICFTKILQVIIGRMFLGYQPLILLSIYCTQDYVTLFGALARTYQTMYQWFVADEQQYHRYLMDVYVPWLFSLFVSTRSISWWFCPRT